MERLLSQLVNLMRTMPFHSRSIVYAVRPVSVTWAVHLAIATATITATLIQITTTKHPPGLGNPFRINRPVSDS